MQTAGETRPDRDYYAPKNREYASLDERRRAALLAELEALWGQHNQANDGGTQYLGEFLEVVAVRAQPRSL